MRAACAASSSGKGRAATASTSSKVRSRAGRRETRARSAAANDVLASSDSSAPGVASRELTEQERIAAGLARQRDSRPPLRSGAPARSRQRRRAARARSGSRRAARPPAASRTAAASSAAPSVSFAAMRADEQQARRVRLAQQVHEQRGRVGVVPLQVIDMDHDAPVSQMRASSSPSARNARWRSSCASGTSRSATAATTSTRASTGNSRRSAHVSRGKSRPDLALGQAHQVARERVDHGVEALVRHGFALVAAPATARARRRRLLELVEEAIDERALADAGFARQQHDDGLVAERRRRERRAQRRALAARDRSARLRDRSHARAAAAASSPSARRPRRSRNAAASGRCRGCAREQLAGTARRDRRHAGGDACSRAARRASASRASR